MRRLPAEPEGGINLAKEWLTGDVFPLWFGQGRDPHGFVEFLSSEGAPLVGVRRAMTQSRQIYSFRSGLKLGCCSPEVSRLGIETGLTSILERFSLPSGEVFHSLDPSGVPADPTPDLYAQAFTLFGLANAFAASAGPELKEKARARAKKLHRVLRESRRMPLGGYAELESGKGVLRSNPHMHLFEAALAWWEADSGAEWRELAAECLDLCLTRFIDGETGLLAERFDDAGRPERDAQGRFYFEPGHHFEWSWLLAVHEKLSGDPATRGIRAMLFDAAEKHGICPVRRTVLDEVWSDLTPKKLSSRFWPQCERIKAAVRLGSDAPADGRLRFANAADVAFSALFRYFETPVPGLWHDVLPASNHFEPLQASKSSSLYHIINAIDEYAVFRPKLTPRADP